MNRRLAIRRLWWKELRQLWPLVALLLLLGVLLQGLTLWAPVLYDWRHTAVLLGMPGLFAVGAGALLVGQEKELRTMDWLRSLPLHANDLARTKLLVGLAGLATVWLASLLLGLATGQRLQGFLGDVWIYPLHSLFVLLLGYATAWAMRSSLVSLLVVVPLACLPFLAASIHDEWMLTDRLRSNEPRPWVMALYLGLFSVGALVWGWRMAARYLAPSPPPREVTGERTTTFNPARGVIAYSRSAPVPALLWQFLTQNRAALIGLTALLASSILLSFGVDPKAPQGPLPPLSILGSFLAISWLGLLVFQSDGLQRRVAFLADRGVSPAATWLTRQAFPLVILVCALGLFAVVLSVRMKIDLGTTGMIVVIPLVLTAFAAAQWLGQLLRSPIVTAILAPFVSAGLLGYFYFAKVELGAAIWVLGIALVLPFLATWVATRAWMDGRSGLRFWSWHGGLLFLALLLPTLNALMFLATGPRMSWAAQAELRDIARRHPLLAGSANTITLPINPRTASGEQDAGEEDPASNVAEARRRSIAGLREQLAIMPGATGDMRTLRVCFADAVSVRLRDPQAEDASMTKRYRESVALLLELSERYRESDRLLEQHLADVGEIWLLEELTSPLAVPRLGEELHATLRTYLSDSQGRNAARRRAIAHSWLRVAGNNLGGYSLHSSRAPRVSIRDLWESKRKLGLVSERLLQLLDAPNEQARLAIRLDISRLMGFPANRAQAAPIYLQTDVGRELLMNAIEDFHLPGALWGGEWELEARQSPGAAP
ncbi:MAG: hypothetical protein KDA45_04665 [Planctomycetales bacterium]|nr:hypothetical protein [Planctomycetales bacterium]